MRVRLDQGSLMGFFVALALAPFSLVMVVAVVSWSALDKSCVSNRSTNQVSDSKGRGDGQRYLPKSDLN